MQKLLKPSDFAARLRKGETRDQIFVDGSGGYKAKLIGLQAGTEIIESEDRSVGFVISSNALDRYNSTIAVDGWQTEAFEQNPVVLWAHDDSIPAIARASKPTADKKALRSIATFADRDTHPLADTVFRLIKGQFISAASVGWIPIRYEFVEDSDRGFGVDYIEQELLEWSVVNIPANPECLVGARSMGIDTKPLLQWAERTLDQAASLLIPRDELEALRKAAGSPTVARPVRRVGRKMKRGGPVVAGRQKAPEMGIRAEAKTGDANKAFAESAAALKTLFVNGALKADEFADRLITLAGETRAGRVLSKENEDALRAAHDCMQRAQEHVESAHQHCVAASEHHAKACEHVMGVLDHCDPDDDEGDTEHPDGDNEGDDERSARERRARRVRLLKLSTSSAAIAAASR